jgi:aminoglycoside phosphotransferase (APT) family kinase protein
VTRAAAQKGMEQVADFAQQFAALIERRLGGEAIDLRRLTGGASLQTWSFDLRHGATVMPLILRRLPPGQAPLMNSVPLATEAAIITEAAEHGVPVANIRLVLDPADGLGEGFVADRVGGLALPTKILREERFADLRQRLASRFGEILARIHRIPAARVPELSVLTATGQLESMERSYLSRPMRSPVFELAFKWLRKRLDRIEGKPLCVIHGDFRLGNIMVDERDVTAVLDWELVHIGDPAEDLGWITVNSWRFGNIGSVVAGVGTLEQLLEGYRSQGGAEIEPERVLFWRALGSLRWGVGCGEMSHAFEQGRDRSIERGMIGRRVSETELDLLDIIAS